MQAFLGEWMVLFDFNSRVREGIQKESLKTKDKEGYRVGGITCGSEQLVKRNLV